MKKIILVLIISFSLLCAGCGSQRADDQTVPQEKPAPVSHEAETSNEYEEITSVLPDGNATISHLENRDEVHIATAFSSSVRPDNWDSICGDLCAVTPADERMVIVILHADDGTILANIRSGKVFFDFYEEQTSPYNPPTISLAEFNAIHSGMTFAEVVDLIGSEGTQLSHVDAGIGTEYVTEMRQWDGEGSFGANANVTFQGGAVVAKAQFGLE